MKLLAAIFAAITTLAALLGFTTHEIPIFAALGKLAAALALLGFLITAIAYTMDEVLPLADFNADDIHV